MDVKLSIIVPVYNVEKYLERCLETLVNQTIKEYEIIIVVDGSTDNSIEIVKKYKEKYSNLIKYVETENRGLSAARNHGIDLAKGEYIGFVDSDDYISTNMYEKLYKCAKDNNYDVVVCSYCKVTDENEEEIKLGINKDSTLEEIIINSRPYAWNKIYKKDSFEKYNLKFPEGLIFEDVCTVYPLLMQSKKIGYVSEKMYFYSCNRTDSIMKKKNRNDLCLLKILTNLNEYCIKNDLFDTYNDLISEINVRHIYYRFRELKNYNNKKYNLSFIYKSFKFLKGYFPKWKSKCNYSKKIKKTSKYMILWQLRILLGR